MRISDWSSDVCSSDLRRGGIDIGVDPEIDFRGHRLADSREGVGRAGNPVVERRHAGFRQRIARRRPVPYDPGEAVLCIAGGEIRSDDPTSELQSLKRILYAGFCLKKKVNTLK